MYKNRIDSETTISYDGKNVFITQEEENWGSARPLRSTSIKITDLSRLEEALTDIRGMKLNEW